MDTQYTTLWLNFIGFIRLIALFTFFALVLPPAFVGVFFFFFYKLAESTYLIIKYKIMN